MRGTVDIQRSLEQISMNFLKEEREVKTFAKAILR